MIVDLTLYQVFACLVLLFISRLVYLTYLSPLSAIPNAHFTSPFSKLWLIYHKFQGGENRTRLAAHKRLGPVVRLGPNEISIDCMDGVGVVFEDKAFNKTNWYPNGFRGWK